MVRQILIGGTGSGKTYKAIHDSISHTGDIIYMAPCRQLVYETAIKYGDIESTITTGELTMTGKGRMTFGVYESFTERDFNDFKGSIIVDEIHFITDSDRGPALIQMLDKLRSNRLVNIYVCTATPNFDLGVLSGYETLELASPFKPKLREIEEEEFFKKVELGVPSIYFHMYADNVGMFGGKGISANVDADDRLEIQLDFTRGNITFIESTNVLAQGLNFPAQNILIEHNDWDTDEIIIQKIGRLARRGFFKEGIEYTYCVYSPVPKELDKKEVSRVLPDDKIDECTIDDIMKAYAPDNELLAKAGREYIESLPEYRSPFKYIWSHDEDEVDGEDEINIIDIDVTKYTYPSVRRLQEIGWVFPNRKDYEVREFLKIERRLANILKRELKEVPK